MLHADASRYFCYMLSALLRYATPLFAAIDAAIFITLPPC